MLKRIASVMGAAILAFGALSGCGESPSAPETTGAAVDQFDKLTTSGSTGPTIDSETGSPFTLKPYERLLKELKLTDEQAAKARRCLEQYSHCVKEARKTYEKAQHEINKRYEHAVREIKHLVEKGELTADQGREKIAAAKAKAQAAHRELLASAKKSVAQCERSFEHCIREFLTREQIARWERLMKKR